MNDCDPSVGLAYKREKEKDKLKGYLFIYLNNNVPYQSVPRHISSNVYHQWLLVLDGFFTVIAW